MRGTARAVLEGNAELAIPVGATARIDEDQRPAKQPKDARQ